MRKLSRPRLSGFIVAACAGEQVTAPAATPEAGETQTVALDTTCQVELPATGAGSLTDMADEPVASAIANNPALSSLAQAVQQAGLAGTLNNLPAATVFAPSDEAFTKVPRETFNAILADPSRLTSILTLHVVPEQNLDAQALARMGSVTTANGQQLTLGVEDRTLTVNDQAKVICPNVQTANATVHIIDTVLMPRG